MVHLDDDAAVILMGGGAPQGVPYRVEFERNHRIDCRKDARRCRASNLRQSPSASNTRSCQDVPWSEQTGGCDSITDTREDFQNPHPTEGVITDEALGTDHRDEKALARQYSSPARLHVAPSDSVQYAIDLRSSQREVPGSIVIGEHFRS